MAFYSYQNHVIRGNKWNGLLFETYYVDLIMNKNITKCHTILPFRKTCFKNRWKTGRCPGIRIVMRIDYIKKSKRKKEHRNEIKHHINNRLKAFNNSSDITKSILPIFIQCDV